ncbi:MAG: phosphonopyruvate decarboxylase [Alteromonadaceae bacterium]|nr:phosphonopyruvate decarboxylase [Alteromonadaceae bacterium]
MLKPENYLNDLTNAGIEFFAGVPDSLLKQICACITDKLPANNHIITANEGAAIGLAIGHHIATNGVPLVYMQNSGLGNIVNPVMSLASPEVYGVPMVMLIGWRGQPGIKDEPQHVHQGRVTEAMLASMEVPVWVLSKDPDTARNQTNEAVATARRLNAPVAILVEKGTFDSYSMSNEKPALTLKREDAIIAAAAQVEDNGVIVCTTGMPSRELFEYRAREAAGHQRDFLTVGGMGHASQIALGIALKQPSRPVYCFDGDGAALMHMGSLAVSGQSGCSNFVHIVLNNGAHESVGGQPTVAFKIDLPAIAKACGYVSAVSVDSIESLEQAMVEAKEAAGPSFVEVRVLPGHRSDIGRPTTTPAENKKALMKHLQA